MCIKISEIDQGCIWTHENGLNLWKPDVIICRNSNCKIQFLWIYGSRTLMMVRHSKSEIVKSKGLMCSAYFHNFIQENKAIKMSTTCCNFRFKRFHARNKKPPRWKFKRDISWTSKIKVLKHRGERKREADIITFDFRSATTPARNQIRKLSWYQIGHSLIASSCACGSIPYVDKPAIFS